MSELKPCPFCGYEPETRKVIVYPNGEKSLAFIKCRRCNYWLFGYNYEVLVAHWNCRPIENTQRCCFCRQSQRGCKTRDGRMMRLFNKDVPFITYIIHDKNMKNGRTVTVYKPTQEYYILFELIKFRRLPATFPDIGITVISEGLEPSPPDVSTTQDVTTPEPPEVK